MAPVVTTPADLTRYCDAAGMKPDSPLRAALTMVYEAAVTAHACATDQARGLTKEGEAALIDRVTDAAGDGASRKAGRLAAGRLALAGVGMLALLSTVGAGAFYAGQQQAVAGREAASFVADVAALNDPASLRRHCLSHSYAQGGGTACQLPPVWIRR